MTNQNFTSINIVLDRSGSMTKLSNETITGFNKFLADQKALDGKATITLATFASDYKLVHDFVPLESVSDLTLESYKTGGYTALLSALSQTIDKTGEKLSNMPEEERPGKVLFVVITDGQENFSHNISTITREKVFEKINHQSDKYSWNFVFLGCDQTQISDAMKLGMSAGNTLAYTPDSKGIAAAYGSISTNTASYRGGTRSKVGNFFDLTNSNKPKTT